MSSDDRFGAGVRNENPPCRWLTSLTVPCLCASVLVAAWAQGAKAQDEFDPFASEAADLSLLNSLQSPEPRVFWGLALSDRRSSTDYSADGSATIGLTFGDVDRILAVRAAAVITSLSDEFGDSGYLAARFSRRVDLFGIPVEGALTFSNLAGWGDASGNVETAQISLAVTPVFQTSGGWRIPIRLSIGAKADIEDFSANQEYSISALAQWSPRFSTNLALVDGRMDIGAGVNFPNLLGRDDTFFVGLTLADALDSDNFRRVVFRTGFSIPLGN